VIIIRVNYDSDEYLKLSASPKSIDPATDATIIVLEQDLHNTDDISSNALRTLSSADYDLLFSAHTSFTGISSPLVTIDTPQQEAVTFGWSNNEVDRDTTVDPIVYTTLVYPNSFSVGD